MKKTFDATHVAFDTGHVKLQAGLSVGVVSSRAPTSRAELHASVEKR